MRQLKQHAIHQAKKVGRHLWDHFVPHERNGHNPHVLKHRVLYAYSVLLVLLKVLVIVVPIALPSSSLYSSAITPQNIIDLTNQTRKNLNLGELQENSRLQAAAEAKAENMLQEQYFAHTSPAGVTPWSWMAKAGYRYLYAGENLAVHFTSAEGVGDGWLASPSHRANIVNSRYTEIGIGVSQGEFEGFPTTFVVQMFGQPIGTVATSQVPSVQNPTPVRQVSVARQRATVAPRKVAAAETQPKPVTPEGATSSVPQPAPVELQPVPVAVLSTPAPAALNLTQEVPALPALASTIVPAEPSPAVAAVTPVVDEASLSVIQKAETYQVRLKVTGASAVAVTLANQWATLAQVAGTAVWQGEVPYDVKTFGPSGEQLSVVAWSPSGSVMSEPLAWVAPKAQTQQVYTFNEGADRYATLFGFLTVHNLADSVRRFYFYFLIGLTGAFFLNLLVKFRVQQLSVINHTMLVMVLTLLMIVI